MCQAGPTSGRFLVECFVWFVGGQRVNGPLEHDPHVLAQVVDVDGPVDEADDAVVDVAYLEIGAPAVGRAGPEDAQDVPQRQVVGANRQLTPVEPVLDRRPRRGSPRTVAVVVGLVVRV